jgi:DNA-directed RNA polymerase specialized sigma24 family protein
MENSRDSTSFNAPKSPFPPTLWTVVMEAAEGDPTQVAEALQKLCAIYRVPILTFLLRRGLQHADAEDLSQQFTQHLLEENRFKHFVRGKTKFRSFLLECLQRFVRGEWRKASAEKRGGGKELLPLEVNDCACQPSFEKLLDTKIALEINRRVIGRLNEKFTAGGKGKRFEELQPFILGADDGVPYAIVAERLQMKANAVKKAVFDLREVYCQMFQEEVAEIASPNAVQEELRYLITLLAETEPNESSTIPVTPGTTLPLNKEAGH